MQSVYYFILLSVFVCVNGKNVCFDELGCFSDSAPYSGSLVRPISLLPELPDIIDTKFYLNTRRIQNESIRFDNIPVHFNPLLPTKFIIYGFIQNLQKRWITRINEKLLIAQDSNIILVDWSKGNNFPYTQAANNARLVGAEIARLIKYLVNKTSTSLSMFHLIGHSLGAHVAGYAGERVQQIMNANISRITGLDPAGPLFEFTDKKVRLDPSDAEFVDVIHSDGASNLHIGLGLLEKSGTIDFYPNGGRDQTNCAAVKDKIITGLINIVTLNIDELEDISGCSHVAAYKFFIDSIENPSCYTSYPCSSIEEFKLGNCIECSKKGCNKMGYWADPSKDSGDLYLTTQDAHIFPFCQHHYQVNLTSNDISGMKQASGLFTIILKSTSNQISEAQIIDDSETVFTPNSTFKRLITLDQKLEGDVNQLIISYKRTNSFFNRWFYDLQWSFRIVELFDGNNQVKLKFCPKQVMILSGDQIQFELCN